jgi:hypothetical protein
LELPDSPVTLGVKIIEFLQDSTPVSKHKQAFRDLERHPGSPAALGVPHLVALAVFHSADLEEDK